MKKSKRIYVMLATLALAGLKVSAQSTDALYPMGEWQTVVPEEGKAPKYFVGLSINREKGECGVLSISEYETDKTLFLGSLTYAGKEMKNDMPTGTYYFNAKTDQGKVCTISVNGDRKPLIIGTGELKDHPAFWDEISFFPISGGTMGEVFAQCCNSEKELLDDLRMSLKDRRIPVVGFGNVQQYINAHAKLDASKPKYLKPRGTGAINIRANASTTSAKVGELRSGQTLLVIDEYDGWCQVRLNDKEYGWVSLGVVTLTNKQ